MPNSRDTSWRRLAAVLAGVSVLATLSTLLAAQAEARTVTGVNPVLGFESAAFNADHSVTVRGWVLNPPAVKALAHAYIYVDDLASPNNVLPTIVRSDVRRLYPAAPATTGFTFRSKRLGYGRHTVCVISVTFGSTPSRRSPRLCRVLNYPDPTPAPTINQKLTGYAKTFIDKYHYQEGGRTPATGFDCAGLTSYVYAHYSIDIAPEVGRSYPTAPAPCSTPASTWATT